MPCGCAERREKIVAAWHRVKGLMTNGQLIGVERAKAERERLAAEARNAAHGAIKQRQQELTEQARRRRAF